MTPDERQHQRRMARYQRQVTAIYDDLCREAARIGRAVPFQAGGDFDLDHYPSQKKQLAALIREAAADIEATIESAVEQEWHESEAKNDDLLQRAKPARLTAALRAFKARKEAGLRLSDRVWNIASQTEADLTEALSRGIAQGQDARSLTQSVKEYLRDPTALWSRYWEGTGESRQRFWRRRVVDESGRVRFVKQPLSHPGRGVYRSAYKNALRLTATETNIAYRTADHEQWRTEPLVLGIRISISNNHPVEDICDLLGGPKNIYPRDFKFTGWHPFCRCAPIPVLPKEEERLDYLRRMARGEDVSQYPFKGRAEDLPQRFKDWLTANRERIDGAKSLPYFIKDNQRLIKPTTKPQAPPQPKPARTQQQADDIKRRYWANHLPANLTTDERDAIAQNILDIENALGIKKGSFMNYTEANTGSENPNYIKGGKYRDNCQTCTVTHIMRRRGFDVEANSSDAYKALKGFNWKERFLEPSGSTPDYNLTYQWKKQKGYINMTSQRVQEYISEQMQSDGLYEVYCGWKGSRSAHVFLAERKGGITRYFDPQTAAQDASSYFADMKKDLIGIIRIDNKIINPKILSIFKPKTTARKP